MTFASGGRHGLNYVVESTFAETPVSPDMTALRHTSCDLGLSKSMLETAEIRENRQISLVIHGQETVVGDIGFELAYGSFDDLLAAAMQSDWAFDELKSGTEQRSFTVERVFPDITTYQRLSGCVVDKLNLSIKPDALVSGQFSLLGQTARFATTALDATPTTALANDPFNSFSATLNEGGNALAIVAGLELSIDNEMAASYVVGGAGAASIYAGKSNIKGEILTFFESADLLEKFRSETASSLSVTLNSAAGSLSLSLPNIVYTGGDNAAQGDGPITLSLPFTAIYDETAAASLIFTRTVP